MLIRLLGDSIVIIWRTCKGRGGIQMEDEKEMIGGMEKQEDGLRDRDGGIRSKN